MKGSISHATTCAVKPFASGKLLPQSSRYARGAGQIQHLVPFCKQDPYHLSLQKQQPMGMLTLLHVTVASNAGSSSKGRCRRKEIL